MLETSKDLLFLTLALCIAIITGFFSYAMYKLIKISKSAEKVVKDAESIVNETKEKVHSFWSAAEGWKHNVENSLHYAPFIWKGVKEIVDFVKKKKDKPEEIRPEKEN